MRVVVNVEALIDCLGETDQNIFDVGLILYREKPTGLFGRSNINVDIVKEGVYLYFNRDERVLNEITLTVLGSEIMGYYQPNKLSHPLKNETFRNWIQEEFGESNNFSPLRKTEEKYRLHRVI